MKRMNNANISLNYQRPFSPERGLAIVNLLAILFIVILASGCVSRQTPRALNTTSTISPGPTPGCVPPKEERIAFIARREGKEGICSVRADGTGLDCLGFPPIGSIGLDAVWSPDYSQVALSFAPFYEEGRYQSHLYLLDGSLGYFTLLSSQGDAWWPVWSPDGRKIAYQVRLSDRVDYDIWMIDLATQRVSPVTYKRAEEVLGGWSAEGDRLFFLSDQDGDRPEVYVENVNDSERKQLTHTGLAKYGLKVSPDGEYLLFLSATIREEGIDPITGDPADYRFRLFVMRNDGSGLEELPFDQVIWDFSWTPQGDRVLILGGDPSTVYVIELEGREVTAVIQGENLDRYSPLQGPLAGSLDGTKLAFRCHTFDLCVSDYLGMEIKLLEIRRANLEVVGGIQWVCRGK